MDDLPFEICISQGGHEIRLPGIEHNEIAEGLASILADTFPQHRIEIAFRGIRVTARPANKALVDQLKEGWWK